MKTIKLFEKVISAQLLDPDLMVMPHEIASEKLILQEESLLPRKLSKQHKELLGKWNGIHLDIIRIYGCNPTNNRLYSLSDSQMETSMCKKCSIIFGDDPAGFLYLESNDGEIFSYDTKSDVTKLLAVDLEDFFIRLVFGADSEDFAGIEWKDELIDSGIFTEK